MITTLLLAASIAAPGATHDRGFWIAIAQNKYEVPAGEQPYALLVEMNQLLGSPDPVLRDDVAYTAAARWIYSNQLLTRDQQKTLLTLWLQNLRVGLGERGTDTVFRRSFSALNLSVLAAADNRSRFLTQAEYDDFLARTLDYFAREQDTRGYDPVKGWMHSPAHTADLLKFLARSEKLPRPGQGRILQALFDKCRAVGPTFAWGEDERLAQVVRSIVRREDFDSSAFDAWVATYPPAFEQLWSHGSAIDAAAFPAVQNMKQVLRAAFVALSQDNDLSPGATAARQRILDVLKST